MEEEYQIVEDNNEEMFCANLLELISNFELRERMSQAAAQSVDRFNFNIYSENIKNVVKNI